MFSIIEKGLPLVSFSKHVGLMESNEAEILTTLEALQTFVSHFQGNLVVKSDSLNVSYWASSSIASPWWFHFYLTEIKSSSLLTHVEFKHVGRLDNDTG